MTGRGPGAERRPQSRRKPVAVLGLLALLAAPALAAAPTATNSYARLWAERARDIDENLGRGEWEKARRRAERLLDDMTQSIVSGEDVGAALASVLTYLAVAEAGVGDLRAALWDWQTAQQLFPDAARFDLAKFGDVTKPLTASPPHTFEEPSADVLDRSGVDPGAVTAPEKLKTPLPKFPEAKRQQETEVSVLVQAIVDTDGSVESPVILESKGELTMVLASLQAFKRWRFKPSTYQGRPVRVFYTLTVNFKLRS